MKKNSIIGLLAAKLGRIVLNNALVRTLARRSESIDAALTLKIERWIKEKKWKEDIRMEQVAEDLDVSHYALSSYFRFYVGKPFLKWRMEVRIEEAARILLEHPDIPASVTGVMVGIPDRSNFRRQFRKIKGCSPTEWRKLKH